MDLVIFTGTDAAGTSSTRSGPANSTRLAAEGRLVGRRRAGAVARPRRAVARAVGTVAVLTGSILVALIFYALTCSERADGFIPEGSSLAFVKLPKTAQNPLSSIGVFLTTVSAVLFVLLFFVDLFGLHTNPYLGMVAFLVLPALFILGLVLIPLGMLRERRRLARGLEPSQWTWGRIDLNDPAHRRQPSAIVGRADGRQRRDRRPGHA